MSRRFSSADVMLAVACVVWGTNFVVVKSALDEFSPLAFNGMRFGFGASILLWMQWRYEGLGVLRPFLPRLVAIGLVGNVCYQLLFIYGLDGTQASQAGLLTATTPIWVLLLVRLTGHDTLGPKTVAGMALAFGGVTVLLWESFGGAAAEQRYWVGNLMLLGSSASWAVYTVYSQPLLLHLRPLALTSATMVAGAVPLLLIAIPDILAMQFREVSLASWGGLMYSTLMALVFGYLAWSRGVQAIGSARTAVYVHLIPVVATLTAWFWLNERLSSRQLLAALAIIAGIGLSRRTDAGV